MSFDASPRAQQNIAIVGGGISGLAAGYLLSSRHRVTIYEAAPRWGGHARTVMAGLRGDQPVDTGFIVFNYANYPHLTAMFRDLDVPVERSDMSFGATIDNGRVEYGLRDLAALIGQKRNLARPAFLRMVRDILRFNARAESVATSDDMTVDDLVARLGLGDWFRRYYLLPVCGAIWSSPVDGIGGFPARTLVRFFRNHALLSTAGQHQWWTVSGGSMQYLRRLTSYLESMGVALRAGTPVTAVTRSDAGAMVHAQGCEPALYDHVIMACHSDQALDLLADPSQAERRALGAIRYQDNHMVLHRDMGQMPKRRACWSSWVYKCDGGAKPQIGVSYWMNRLQNIPEDDPLFVTLNPAQAVEERLIYDQKTFRHPVFDRGAIAAQGHLRDMQGQRNTWFAGAYTRHGFHEDGFASAVRIVRAMDKQFASPLLAESVA